MNGMVEIHGGKKLKGEVKPIANKNSVVAVLPAALLSKEKVVYEGIPQTSDVDKILAIMEKLGAKVKREGGRVEIKAEDLINYKIDEELGGQFRASLMFVGPLLARMGKARIPLPGGCVLGHRSISGHVDVFRKVGVKVKLEDDSVFFEVPEKLEECYRIWQLEASVTATENLLMYAAGIETQIEIVDAAAEPHVVELQELLQRMGAEIEGLGSNKLTVRGKSDLRGSEFTPGPDFVDIAGFMVAAAVTDGKIRILGANKAGVIDGLIDWFGLFGVKVEKDGDDIVVEREEKGLRYDLSGRYPMAADNLPKLYPRPWPGFPVDVIPVMATLACKTKGRLMLKNWMYESGFDFVRELNSLGGDIVMADPQRILIHGPVSFTGGEVAPPKVIQSTKAVFLAALADEVRTVIHGVDILKRRYPDIISVYKGLGAEIKSEV